MITAAGHRALMRQPKEELVRILIEEDEIKEEERLIYMHKTKHEIIGLFGDALLDFIFG